MDTDTGPAATAGAPRRGPRGAARKHSALAAASTAGFVAVAACAGALVLAGPAAAATTLRAGAESDGRYFGVAVGQGDLGNGTATNVAGTQFDMVTPENEMKWDTIEPSNGSYNFGPGDAIVNFATSHNERVRGHNLVWHNQLPGWVTSLPLSQVKAAMEAHITAEVSHYKGKIYAWDVVNEPFNDDGSFRQDVFYNAFGGGAAYIADALRTAHAADPNAKLYINDYNIEGSGAKSDAMYSLAQTLLQQGAPLSGIGFESHFIVGQVPGSLASNMQRFTALGLDVAITELDDRIQTPASSANLQQQATDDANIVKVCLNNAHCPGVTQWNISDADSWVPGTFPGWGAATLFDGNYQPKPAYNAVLTALAGGSVPPPSSPPPTTSTPPTSPPPTSPSATATTPASGTCQVSDAINAWNTGLTASITITNNSGAAINGWSLAFTLPSGQSLVSAWNATVTPNSGAVTATNLSYNASIPAGGSVSFGFQASHTGNAAAPASFSLNGTACTSG
ncbi:MAG TPA: endo-1,4-beta-xylanase [Actinospica sp.]|nr:endo-1,4-beta-xylanase [Actinospica sp.]